MRIDYRTWQQHLNDRRASRCNRQVELFRKTRMGVGSDQNRFFLIKTVWVVVPTIVSNEDFKIALSILKNGKESEFET